MIPLFTLYEYVPSTAPRFYSHLVHTSFLFVLAPKQSLLKTLDTSVFDLTLDTVLCSTQHTCSSCSYLSIQWMLLCHVSRTVWWQVVFVSKHSLLLLRPEFSSRKQFFWLFLVLWAWYEPSPQSQRTSVKTTEDGARLTIEKRDELCEYIQTSQKYQYLIIIIKLKLKMKYTIQHGRE